MRQNYTYVKSFLVNWNHSHVNFLDNRQGKYFNDMDKIGWQLNTQPKQSRSRVYDTWDVIFVVNNCS